jgi:hypothetical protein
MWTKRSAQRLLRPLLRPWAFGQPIAYTHDELTRITSSYIAGGMDQDEYHRRVWDSSPQEKCLRQRSRNGPEPDQDQ